MTAAAATAFQAQGGYALELKMAAGGAVFAGSWGRALRYIAIKNR